MSDSWWARITCPNCGDLLVGVAQLAVDTDSGMVAVDCPDCGRRWRSGLTAGQLASEIDELMARQSDSPAARRVRCAALTRRRR